MTSPANEPFSAALSTESASLFSAPSDLFPEGITVERNVFGRELTWFIFDRETGLAASVSVKTEDHLVEWSPPPPLKWWRWFSPLGAALDSADRAALIGRMRRKMVVDWDAVERHAKAEGERVIRDLLARRPT